MSDIGAYVRSAREAVGLTQEELAGLLGVSRYAIIEIEKGARRISADELMGLAHELERPLEFFFTGEPSVEVAVARRSDGPVSSRVKKLEMRLQRQLNEYRRVRDCLQIAGQLDAVVKRAEHPSSAVALGNSAAREQREAIRLGSGPIRELRMVVEQRLGVPVFGATLREDTDFCGMLVFVEGAPLIAGMLFNSQFPVSRCNFTIAHEWGHLVWQLSEGTPSGDIYFTGEESDQEEMFANAFAAQLLAPDEGIDGWLRAHVISDGAIDPETVQHIASDFGISFRAMTYRLQNTGHVSERVADDWRANVRVSRLSHYTGEFSCMPDMSPTFKHHVLCAFHEGDLSAAKCGEILGITAAEFMEIVDAAGRDLAEEAAITQVG